MADRLQELLSGLEQQVAERTRALERRAVQLQAAAEVGQAAASIRDLDALLSQVTHLISERFGFYHVGVFLIDEREEYAVLRAANSPGGQQMLARGHRLGVGKQGIVGHVTGTREPRVALDVGDDAVFFDSPDLPDTRSEMALPLVVGDQLLGALDVQSSKEAAFTQEDIAVLQVLADQVAMAIDNTRLLAEARSALEAERRAYGEISREAWAEIFDIRPDLSFRSSEHGVTDAGDVWKPEMEQAWLQEKVVQGSEGNTDGNLPLALPIKVRGNVIGVLDTYKLAAAGTWTTEEVALLEALTEQVGMALESARLHQETRQRAERERLAAEVTARMRETLDVETVLKTAVQEVRQALGVPEVEVRLAASAMEEAGNGVENEGA
jgi:GAF domain-containing protein